jgi:hypothetical protein
MLPAPCPRADGAPGRSTDSARHPTPRLSASPSLGVDGMPGQAGNTLVHPSPLLLASPFTGVDGRLCREGGIQQQSFPLPANPTLSTAAPSWASVVRDGTSSGSPPALQREEFFRLYERCVASGLRARVEIKKRRWLSRSDALMLPSDITERQRRAMRPSLTRSAPLRADPSTRCPSPRGQSTRQLLRSRQHGRNRRLRYRNKRYPSTHCPSPHGPSTRRFSLRTPRPRQPNGLGRQRGGGVRWSC